MADYDVKVLVERMGTTGYDIRIFPERLTLSGQSGNTITWLMLQGSVGRFTAKEDVAFVTEAGQRRFPNPSFSGGKVTVTTAGEEVDETIYRYGLTVHVGEGGTEQAIRVDPEVDNPPPPPTGPPAPPGRR